MMEKCHPMLWGRLVPCPSCKFPKMIPLQTENGHKIKQGFKVIDQVSSNAFITGLRHWQGTLLQVTTQEIIIT